MNTDQLLQAVTVSVVAGLIVYWFTAKANEQKFTGNGPNSMPGDYRPLIGDVRTTAGQGTSTDKSCSIPGNVPSPDNTAIPIATDYLNCAPAYNAPISRINVGESMQADGCNCGVVWRKETASTFPHGIKGPNTLTRPVVLQGAVSCAPHIPLQVDCTEIV